MCRGYLLFVYIYLELLTGRLDEAKDHVTLRPAVGVMKRPPTRVFLLMMAAVLRAALLPSHPLHILCKKEVSEMVLQV